MVDFPSNGPGAPTSAPGSNTPASQSSTTETAKNEARGVAQEAGASASAVGQTAKDEATNVAREAQFQAKDLIHQSRQELMHQASAQQERAAQGLKSLHEELSSLAEKSENPGVGTDLVRQAAQRAGAFAEYLGQRDPGSLLNEVKSYARRKPGTFLAIAAGAGLLAGRLTRSLAAGASNNGAGQQAAGGTSPEAYPAGHGYAAGGTGAYPEDAGLPATGGVPAYPDAEPSITPLPGGIEPAVPGYEPRPDGYGQSPTVEHSSWDEGAVQEGAIAGSPAYGAPPGARHATAPGADLEGSEERSRLLGEDADPVTDEIPPMPREDRGGLR
ncbi:hypothetical protein [Sinomonas susongensis]|uniref:hypothetical protein n=1 Tax=Sinomonas susongensis TaxID=1324851 RepID=UPI001109B4F2|nr:hypothetical protein [Sinomonas susongensis]